jgi:ribosomal-protein-alanine N-acetyltransferase
VFARSAYNLWVFERVETNRLLRKPVWNDAEAIFVRYASDPEVTRLLGWPRHTSKQDTRAFLQLSEAEWARWPAGPYVVESRQNGLRLGATGLAFETPDRAATGYVFRSGRVRQGYATESLRAVVGVARDVGVIRLYALCHPENLASQRVLEKCGFHCEGILPQHSTFPNLSHDQPYDVLRYATLLGQREPAPLP